MLKHHQESLQLMKDYFQKDSDVIALILGGSVAKGEQRPDSDLDAMVIIKDHAYEKRKLEGNLAECITGICTYPEGYFDVKYFNKAYLEAAVKLGSDPTRNSFIKSKVLFSSDKDIAKIIEQIPIYPKEKKAERIQLFYSILRYASGYFYNSATRNQDQYMLDKCCFEIVYAGLRMLYVHNEVFFPCHLRLIEYTSRLSHKPENIVELAKAVNEKKDTDSKTAFVNAILNFTNWGLDPKSAVPTYVEKMEQTWQYSDDNVYEL
ncbi:MAG: nucleotidyltransferase domain-containing protein [Defluviitaleaceae bacterium]|nr:nucleotidyltransferase domain-containing protein [Defluviitaleaceae bacterium]